MRVCFFLFLFTLLFTIPIGMAAERNRKQAQSAPPEIASISPVQNALNVNKTTNIAVTFNIDINPATLTSNTIKVNGSQSGLHSSSITYNSGTKTVTTNPDSAFKIGEVVSVTLTTGIQSASGAPLSSPYSWSLTINVTAGAGNFAKSSEISVRGADRLTTSDFDDDGDLDLAIINADTTTISILKNNGSGSFTKTLTVNVQGRPNAVSAGDFDGDGDLDLAVPNSPYQSLGAVSILKNNGNGGFSQTQRLTVGYMPFSAPAQDLDGDGDLDLAVSLNGSGGGANSGVIILMNNGNGGFAPTQTVDAPGCEFPLTSGDLDGDGDFDLAVPSHCSFGLSILKNNGGGTFAVSSTVDAGNYPSDVAAGDLDGDGDLDLVVPNRNDASLSNSTVTILKNDGNGNFAKTSSPGISGANPVSVSLGDFDQDGDLDVAVNNAPYNTLSILLNDSAGNFTNSAQPVAGREANQVTTGDFDNDGDLDLAVTNGSANTVSILKKTQIKPPIFASVATPQLAGNEFWAYVKVGDVANPVSNLFGLSFVLNFTHTDYVDVVQPISSNITAAVFLGNDVVIHKAVDEAAGKVRIGISRKHGQTGVNGSGNVVRVKFVTQTTIPTDTQVQFTITDVNAIDPTGAPIALYPRASKVTTIHRDVTVWPGDTNNDGTVNQADVLPLGLCWDHTGPIRANASMNWTRQICPPWTPLSCAYADANGDGKVTEADVLAIGLNWGKTHTAASAFASSESLEKAADQAGSVIQPEVSPSGLTINQEFSVQIKISEVSGLFGLAFELAYDQPNLLQILSVEPDAFLGSDVIFYSNIEARSGKIAIGISRKAGQASVNGAGSVIRVKAKIAANATAGAKINFSLQNVVANDANGTVMSLTPQVASLTVGSTTGIEANGETSAPTSYRLLQNHPNPFTAGTLIKYEIPQAGPVLVKIYNLAGQEILEIVNAAQQPGRYQINWNGRDDAGKSVPSGVYIYKLLVNGFEETKKMTLMK